MDRDPTGFDYLEAFGRNIGWLTEWEQRSLRDKRVAIAGMGGVGGLHLLTLARFGVGAFHIADMDRFELANFNRQVGATTTTVGRPKVEVLAEQARAVNPTLDLRIFADGVDEETLDAFLDGVDLFVDGLDFFVLDVRAKVFARCAERGIPAITAAPLGMSAAYLVFVPGGMTFERYFRLAGLPAEKQYANFFLGLAPAGLQQGYLVDPTRLDLRGQRGPSTMAGCLLCAAVAGTEAVKLLLGREPVRAAPWYHQFDAHAGRFVSRKLRGGNANPLQRLRLRVAYKLFDRLSAQAEAPPAPADGSVLEQILDIARWAPSGDNTQPWRFRPLGDHSVEIEVRDQAGHDVYDYNNGQPSLLSAGMMLECLRIGASHHGLRPDWTYDGRVGDHEHRIRLTLVPDGGVTADPLLPFVTLRSVDRGLYRQDPLTAEDKRALADSLGDTLTVTWFEEPAERRRMSRINGEATDIRLRIREAFEVHQRIIDWEHDRSPDRIPATSLGLDKPTLKMMRWSLADWRRTAMLNRLPAATLMARMQMDYRPGRHCAAHFMLSRAVVPARGSREEGESLLYAGQAVQRFWLTAAARGISLQPSVATIIYAFYGRHDQAFTQDTAIRAKAKALADAVEAVAPAGVDHLLFCGRLGRPQVRRNGPRSVRKPLGQLLVSSASDDNALDAGGPMSAIQHAAE